MSQLSITAAVAVGSPTVRYNTISHYRIYSFVKSRLHHYGIIYHGHGCGGFMIIHSRQIRIFMRFLFCCPLDSFLLLLLSPHVQNVGMGIRISVFDNSLLLVYQELLLLLMQCNNYIMMVLDITLNDYSLRHYMICFVNNNLIICPRNSISNGRRISSSINHFSSSFTHQQWQFMIDQSSLVSYHNLIYSHCHSIIICRRRFYRHHTHSNTITPTLLSTHNLPSITRRNLPRPSLTRLEVP
mmetsp:Transcript_18275/g.39497  ORF Transcript_18275/g.39497 Transcript_18275/m.39497 type:complete len:241 (-) Transcript_18275:74-796(-)